MRWTGKLWLVRAPVPPVGVLLYFEGGPAAVWLVGGGCTVWAHVTEDE